MSKPLSKKLRARWDALIADEGAALGLSACQVFLENKLVNDLFYRGLFRGTPCVVKCSSRAPESIANEYRMSKRLFAEAPVCAEALAHWVSSDGSMAFVVTKLLPGPSLTDIIAQGVDDADAIGILEDMVRIAEALVKTGIVWRDIIPDNLIKDEDGHLRLIDAQFAVDRNDFHEDPYMLSHWKYRYVLFAFHPMMAGHGWNDVAMMLMFAPARGGGHLGDERRKRLGELVAVAAFRLDGGFVDSLRMRVTLMELSVRRAFTFSTRHRAVLDERMARARSFLGGKSRKAYI